jgi:hypothetical protein
MPRIGILPDIAERMQAKARPRRGLSDHAQNNLTKLLWLGIICWIVISLGWVSSPYFAGWFR